MKYLKILGLAAIAAMALMAFLGATGASATTLCTTTENPCVNNRISELDASLVGTAELKTTEGTVLDTCTGGTVKGSITAQGSTVTASGPVATTDLTWTGCTKTTTTNEGGTLEVHNIAGTDNGTVTAKGFVVTVNSIFGSCTFGFGTTPKDLGTLVGGTTAKLEINTDVPRISGLCPADAVWKATYHITNHSAVYVTAS